MAFGFNGNTNETLKSWSTRLRSLYDRVSRAEADIGDIQEEVSSLSVKSGEYKDQATQSATITGWNEYTTSRVTITKAADEVVVLFARWGVSNTSTGKLLGLRFWKDGSPMSEAWSLLTNRVASSSARDLHLSCSTLDNSSDSGSITYGIGYYSNGGTIYFRDIGFFVVTHKA